jgi:hypothetical protein
MEDQFIMIPLTGDERLKRCRLIKNVLYLKFPGEVRPREYRFLNEENANREYFRLKKTCLRLSGSNEKDLTRKLEDLQVEIDNILESG